MKEIWISIHGYESLYEVSNLGNVKSLARRTVTGNRGVPERLLKPNTMRGYHCVTLQRDKKHKVFRVHRLVIEHFGARQPSEEYQVNHIDGNKANNRIDNLEWVTPLENTTHAFNNNLRKRFPTSQTKLKMKKAMEERWQNKEYQESQREMMRNVWKRRKENGWRTWKTI